MTRDSIQFPLSQGHCVKVSIITGARSQILASIIVHPAPANKKYIELAGYSFLIESENRNQKVLYDLGFMKDWEERMPPSLKAVYGGKDIMAVDEFQHVPDAIKAHGIELSEINSIIWSHVHMDHIGDPSVFPPNTELVPSNPSSFVLDSAFEGRTVRELDFSNSATAIGGFRALDFFEDGSIWVLETPGHTAHHICLLCRTTVDSWLLLGGDVCHSVAQLRPNRFRPLPDTVSDVELNQAPSQESLYGLAHGTAEDAKTAEETLEKLKAFDGRDDVMIIIAHDSTLLNLLEFFPQNINDWKAKDWANQGRWLFLKDFL